MKKVATKYQGPFHVECPFCGCLCDRNATLTWCVNCYCEYYKNRKGEVVFDNRRKTPRFAVAKTLAKSGGFGLGKI